MSPILGFPVNLSRNTNGENDDRKVVGEVEFFSEGNKASPSATHHEHHQHVKPNSIINNTPVKKEIIPPDEKPPNSNFHVNIVLQLANTGSDQSVVDDGVSSDAEDKRATTTKLAQLRVELQRKNAEIRNLKEMLTHVLNSMTDGETLRNHNPTSTPGRNRSSGKFNNSGKQTIKGMTNQTGFTEGDANGAINYGNLNVNVNKKTIIFQGRRIGRGRGRGRRDPPRPSDAIPNGNKQPETGSSDDKSNGPDPIHEQRPIRKKRRPNWLDEYI